MDKIPNLDESVINALKFFEKVNFPEVILEKEPKTLVMGSGNAQIAGKILFSRENYPTANESNYLKKLKGIKRVILISASGSKHAPIIAKNLKKKRIKTVLLTNNENSPAKKVIRNTFVFPKIEEPYTYNISTYLGMILSRSCENPKKISKFLEKIKAGNLKKYKSFFIIIPEEFSELEEMFRTKFDELFGSKIEGRIFTYEESKHAKTIIDSNKELFVGLGIENKIFGKNRINFKIPKDANYGLMLSLGYYFIGQIQKQNIPWFKHSVGKYLKNINKVFGKSVKIKDLK